MREKKRYNNYDVLRIICTLSVISIHVASYVISNLNSVQSYSIDKLSYFLSKGQGYSVPCFVMISGAFALGNTRNKDYKTYFKKIWNRQGKITVLASAFFLVITVFKHLSEQMNVMSAFVYTLKETAIGTPYYHMWFMYMIINLYLMVPVIIVIKETVGENVYQRIAIIIFIVSWLSKYTSTHVLRWDPGYSFGWLGYFLLGDIIKRRFEQNKSRCWCVIGILVATIMEIVIALYHQGYVHAILINSQYFIEIIGAIATLLLFVGFSNMSINLNVESLSQNTFFIYLIHAPIWDLIVKIGGWKLINDCSALPLWVKIVFAVILIFMISDICTEILHRVMTK